MNKRPKEALNFIFECLETLDLSKNQNYSLYFVVAPRKTRGSKR